ncbi:unnamed protein product [Oikopleura dioica]|uniref:Uncharacterized protein n=1 Tax=Oikopleura dioica TaxID=34765 RepID=E4XCX4_OIKDI|nr:unnamed protein product [Oikopleura dioica]
MQNGNRVLSSLSTIQTTLFDIRHIQNQRSGQSRFTRSWKMTSIKRHLTRLAFRPSSSSI